MDNNICEETNSVRTINCRYVMQMYYKQKHSNKISFTIRTHLCVSQTNLIDLFRAFQLLRETFCIFCTKCIPEEQLESSKQIDQININFCRTIKYIFVIIATTFQQAKSINFINIICFKKYTILFPNE